MIPIILLAILIALIILQLRHTAVKRLPGLHFAETIERSYAYFPVLLEDNTWCWLKPYYFNMKYHYTGGISWENPIYLNKRLKI